LARLLAKSVLPKKLPKTLQNTHISAKKTRQKDKGNKFFERNQKI